LVLELSVLELPVLELLAVDSRCDFLQLLVDTMSSRSRKKSTSPLRDLAAFRASLWKTLAKNAKHLTGLQIVQALREISDDIYYAGIDSAYTTTKTHDPQNLADAWDLTWLTALNVKLLHLQRSRSRPRRPQ
jgi:hypothetical protein